MHAINAFIHPGPAALMLPRIEIKIKLTPKISLLIPDIKKSNIRVPGINIRSFFDLNAKKPANQIEQALDDIIYGKIGLQVFLG